MSMFTVSCTLSPPPLFNNHNRHAVHHLHRAFSPSPDREELLVHSTSHRTVTGSQLLDVFRIPLSTATTNRRLHPLDFSGDRRPNADLTQCEDSSPNSPPTVQNCRCGFSRMQNYLTVDLPPSKQPPKILMSPWSELFITVTLPLIDHMPPDPKILLPVVMSIEDLPCRATAEALFSRQNCFLRPLSHAETIQALPTGKFQLSLSPISGQPPVVDEPRTGAATHEKKLGQGRDPFLVLGLSLGLVIKDIFGLCQNFMGQSIGLWINKILMDLFYTSKQSMTFSDGCYPRLSSSDAHAGQQSFIINDGRYNIRLSNAPPNNRFRDSSEDSPWGFARGRTSLNP